jgi:hypothetical protein
MPIMRPHSLFPTLGHRIRLAKDPGEFAPDTVKGRIKRKALQLMTIEDEALVTDVRDLDFTSMPMREGYDDSIMASEVSPEYGIDDSWLRLDEESARGVGQYGSAIIGAASTAASMYGQMQAAKAGEKSAAAQLKAAKEGRRAAEVGAKSDVEIARMQLEASKRKGLPKWALPSIIGVGVLGLGVAAYFLFFRKKK